MKATTTATVRVRGKSGDASLPGVGKSVMHGITHLLARLDEHEPRVRIPPELGPLLDALEGDGADDERVARVREAHPALDLIVEGLTRTVIRPTLLSVDGPRNVVPETGCLVLQCLSLPGTSRDEVEQELREALGSDAYDLELGETLGGSISPLGTPLHDAIESFLAAHDPDSRLVPALAYGFTDCHFMRQAYGAVAYGFIPFRHADPLLNLTTKHGSDERVLTKDVAFQALAAWEIARHPLA